MRMLVVVTLAAACTGGPIDPVGSSDQPIIGGTRSTGMISTVLLASYPPDRSSLYTCTGVLISPTVVLTAAHCVDTPNHPNFIYGVFTGDDAAGTLAQLEPRFTPVTAVHAHPMYETGFPFFADLGVAILATPIAIPPAEIQRTPLDQSIVGMPAEIIGYGQTVYQQYNSKRYAAMTTVVAIDNDSVVVGDSQKHACLGDSGGPAFVAGKVVGIDSYGPTGCGAAAHYRRPDFFLPFIDLYAPEPILSDGSGPFAEAGTDPATDSSGCSTHGASGPLLAFVLVGLRRRSRSRRAS